jgi:hypothetical protein
MAGSTPIVPDTELTELGKRVATQSATLQTLNGIQKAGIIEQEKIDEIITTEQTRLENKKSAIDDAITSQNRIIYFNNNTRKVYEAYIKIVIVLAIALAIIWVIRIVKTHIEFIPDWILDILVVATISISLIVIFNYYMDIRVRSRYNFDELNLDAPPDNSNNSKSKGNGGNLFDGISTCVGAACCTTDGIGATIWDEDTSKCIKRQAFTTLTATSSETFIGMAPPEIHIPNPITDIDPNKQKPHIKRREEFTLPSAKPVDAFEYTNYSSYK